MQKETKNAYRKAILSCLVHQGVFGHFPKIPNNPKTTEDSEEKSETFRLYFLVILFTCETYIFTGTDTIFQ